MKLLISAPENITRKSNKCAQRNQSRSYAYSKRLQGAINIATYHLASNALEQSTDDSEIDMQSKFGERRGEASSGSGQPLGSVE